MGGRHMVSVCKWQCPRTATGAVMFTCVQGHPRAQGQHASSCRRTRVAIVGMHALPASARARAGSAHSRTRVSGGTRELMRL